jgi:hypothetical protein
MRLPPVPPGSWWLQSGEKETRIVQPLGLNPYAKVAIGIVLAIAGIATHRLILIVVGAVVVLWSLIGVASGLRDRDQTRRTSAGGPSRGR